MRGKDARGNETHASAGVYVLGDGDVGWRMDDRSSVELVPDKKTYEPGDVARILMKSPFSEADALVTVERAGIYRKERVHLTGSMPTLNGAGHRTTCGRTSSSPCTSFGGARRTRPRAAPT